MNKINIYALNAAQRKRLKSLAAVIDASERSWVNTARSLRAIADEKLFQGRYVNIGAYAEAQHKIKKSRALQLVRAANTYDALEAAGVTQLPLNENQIRPFAPLSADEAVQAWNHALRMVGSPEKVTESVVKEVAAAAREGLRQMAKEDGTGVAPSLSPEAEALVGAPSTTTRQVIADIGLLLDDDLVDGEVPEFETDDGGKMLVSVPHTLYPGATVATPTILVPAANLAGPLDAAAIIRYRDESERLGYKPKMNLTTDSVGWALWTLNLITGCSMGCTYCYAKALAMMYYDQRFHATFYPGRLLALAHTTIPKKYSGEPKSMRVFLNSMGDWMDPAFPDVVVQAMLNMCSLFPSWTFMTLTKRPARLKRFRFPPNVWLGVTVTDQSMVGPMERAFAQVQASVRWVSFEPLLGPIVLSRPELIDLFVIGSQTAANGQPAIQPSPYWVEALKAQARFVGAMIWEKTNLHAPLMETPEPRPERLVVTPAEAATVSRMAPDRTAVPVVLDAAGRLPASRREL